MPSRSQQQRENLARREEPHLWPNPEPISVLAEVLGLDDKAKNEVIKRGLAALTSKADDPSLGEQLLRKIRLIHEATTPERGLLDFCEVSPVSDGTKVLSVNDILNLVVEVKAKLAEKAAASEKLPQQFHSVEEEQQLILPPCQVYQGSSSTSQGLKHVSAVISHVFEQEIDPKVAAAVDALRVAIKYLQDNCIVPPNSSRERCPTRESTEALTNNKMKWIWNKKTCSWDPGLDRTSNQSFFTASDKYFEKIEKYGTIDRQNLIGECKKAREIEKNLNYSTRLGPSRRALAFALTNCASELLGREVHLPRIIQLRALYSFLTKHNS